MLIIKRNITLLFTLFVTLSFSQRAIDGNKVVNTANTIVNEYTTLTANAAAGATTITVAASGLNANNRFGAGNTLAAGDLIMIIQMQGVSVVGSLFEFPAGSGTFYGIPNDNTWGSVTAYNNCGNYEFAEVNSVTATTITVDCGLQHSYTAAGRVQVIRVPRYNNLTVTSPGTIIPQQWATGGVFVGGVVAIEVYGNTIINNANGINANGLGFRGGLSNENNSALGGGQVAMPNSAEGAEKGEGIFGYQADYDPVGGRYCRGPAGNGGGGGDAHNAGGGGGSNAGSLVGWDGLGNPDVSGGAGWVSAWNLEAASFATHTSPGGGRGGYSWGATNQNATVLGPYAGSANAWNGDYRRNTGGMGGRVLDYTTGRLFLGGGGGAGDKNDNAGGNGGNGGGLIYLMNYGTVSGTGSVAANGAVGLNSGVDAAGGGGGGGTIILNSVGTISGISLAVNGGNGGNQVVGIGINESEGPGGGGGGGYTAISNGVITQTSTGGGSGSTNSSGLTEFLPNGATKGAVGTTNQLITADTILASNVTICAGNTATLTATVYGPLPSTIYWYTTQSGGAPVGTGSPFTTPVLGATTTYYVGFCSGTYRIPVTVTVNPGLTVTVNSPTICPGGTATLTGVGATTYAWSTGSTLNPISVSPAVTTTYTVTGTTGGCSGTAIATVTVGASMTVTVNSPTICAGSSATLTAVGGTTYAWSNGSILNPITVSPVTTTTYTVTGTTSGCTGTAISTVTVTPLPIVTVNSPTICAGSNATLTAVGGTTYAWSTGSSSNPLTVSPASTTSYTVTGTTSGCTGTAISTVTVNPSPTITVNSPTICAGSPATLTALGGTTYAWSTGAIINPISVSPAITATYTVTGTTAGCTGTAISTVTVTPLPIITVNSPTICAGATATLTANGGTGYAWSTGSLLNPISVTPAVTATYTVTGTNSGCIASAISTVTVNPLPIVTVNSPTICAGATATLTAVGGTTYSWSTGSILNPISVSPASTTSYTVTGTTAGCTGTAISTVTVNPLPVVTVNSPTICVGSTATLTGNGATSYSWSTGAITNPISVTPAVTTTYTVTGASAGCTASEISTVTVTSTINSTITYVPPVCIGAGSFNMTAATGGGTWTGTGITSGAAGTFDPIVSGIGTFTITYTISGACGSSDTALVVVMNNANATINNVSPFCLGSVPFNLTAATSGGTWSGTGITNSSLGTFTPSSAGVGTFIITYTISGSCGASDTSIVTVVPNSDATIVQPASICNLGASINLTAATGGGNWSGTGITSATLGTFNPGISGVGNFVITYSIGGSCGSSDTVTVTVIPTANSTITPVTSICVGAAPFNLTAVDPGGNWSGTGITDAINGTFSPTIAGIGPHTITYSIGGMCGTTDTVIVNVTSLLNATINIPSALCVGSAPVNLTAATTGGTWSGTGITNAINGTFNPGVGVGTYLITYTIPGACGNSDTILVNVSSPITVSIAPVSPVCVNSSPFNFTASVSGGVWFGTGITSSALGTFDPTNSGAGTFIISYGVAGACGDTATQSIVVNPLPTPSFTTDVTTGCAPLCVQFSEAGSNTCTSVIYNFGDGNTSTSSSATNCYVNSGLYNVSISCTDANNCTGTTTISGMINVLPIPVASFTFSPSPVAPSNTIVSFTDASSNASNYIWDFGDITSGSNTSILSNPSHIFAAEGNYCITLIASNVAGCADSTTDCIVIANEPSYIIPNVFTPNGDLNNDVFFITSSSTKALTCAIYDRWGLKIYEWDSVNGGWDGHTSSGSVAPNGVYYYIMKATGNNEKVTEQQGFIQLLSN